MSFRAVSTIIPLPVQQEQKSNLVITTSGFLHHQIFQHCLCRCFPLFFCQTFCLLAPDLASSAVLILPLSFSLLLLRKWYYVTKPQPMSVSILSYVAFQHGEIHWGRPAPYIINYRKLLSTHYKINLRQYFCFPVQISKIQKVKKRLGY